MSMKVDMLVALLAIHLTTAFSTESAHWVVKSSSSASEIEREPSGSQYCDSVLRRCLKNREKDCEYRMRPCMITASHCYSAYDLCEAAETESAHWEMESSLSASEIERKPGGSENNTDCDSELARCLDKACSFPNLFIGCVLAEQRCYNSRDLCKAAEIESAQSEVGSSSSASEIESKPGGSVTITDCDSALARCLDKACSFPKFLIDCLLAEQRCYNSRDLCKAAEIESAQSEVGSSSSASEIERKPGGSENITECDSQLTQCLENTLEGCGYSMRPCVLIIQHCYRLRDLCEVESAHWEVESSSSASEIERKPGGSENSTESAQSKVGSSLSASEIERKPGGSVTPTECDSELTQCLENTWQGCDQSMKLCALIILRCYGLRDLCEVESAHWQVGSSSSPSEIERKASGSENLTGST